MHKARRGRPRKPGKPTRFPKAEGAVQSITFFLDLVMVWLYALPEMAGITEVVEGIKLRLFHECVRIQANRDEMKKLAIDYNRFVDLMAENAKRRERVSRIIGVLGPEGLLEAMKEDESDTIGETVEISPSAVMLRDELPLWEAMVEYLSHVPEARITEMVDFFTSCGRENANRQAVESALKRRRAFFKTRKRGREKFISLRRRVQEEKD